LKTLAPCVTGPHSVFANLSAAGAILAGAYAVSDGRGAGVALATGLQAGINAVTG
jgi:anaerobic glycerol-3-phosphate dehydrogenase